MQSSLNRESKKCRTIQDFVNLAFSFECNKYNIAPIQIKNEILPLIEVLKTLNPKFILEIGTAAGGTLFLLSKIAATNSTILSVDLPGGKFGGELFPNWKIPLYKSFADKKKKIHIIRADSHKGKTLIEIKNILKGKKLDFLLIDGDHTYNGVKKDFEMYSSLMTKGGIIAFHDINPGPRKNVDGVRKFWAELKSRHPYCEIIDENSQQGYGIGLIFFVESKFFNVNPDPKILKTLIKLREKQLSIYKSNAQMTLNSFHQNPLGFLLELYSKREDLRNSFSEIHQGDYQGLVKWALAVIEHKIEEDDEIRSSLTKHASWYKEFLANKNLEIENKTNLKKLKNIARDHENLSIIAKKLDKENKNLGKEYKILNENKNILLDANKNLDIENKTNQENLKEYFCSRLGFCILYKDFW